MKNILTLLLLTFSIGITAQVSTWTATQSTIFDHTYVVDGFDLIIDGGGFHLDFQGKPKVLVKNGGRLLVRNAKLVDRKNWGTVKCGCFEYRGIDLTGFMDKTSRPSCMYKCDPNFWIDGLPKV